MARRTRVRMDMTPMVDVAFLLLIFFMSTTQFKPPEVVAVDLPLSQSQIHVPETGTIILTVTSAGRLFISTENVADSQELRPDNLREAVVAWRSRNPGAAIVLKGDRDADFGLLADVMDALADTKTLRFNLMTDLAKDTRAKRAARPLPAADAKEVPNG